MKRGVGEEWIEQYNINLTYLEYIHGYICSITIQATLFNTEPAYSGLRIAILRNIYIKYHERCQYMQYVVPLRENFQIKTPVQGASYNVQPKAVGAMGCTGICLSLIRLLFFMHCRSFSFQL